MAIDYNLLYKRLGISVKALDDDYDPEIFGRNLIKGLNKNEGVIYASSTDYEKKKDCSFAYNCIDIHDN